MKNIQYKTHGAMLEAGPAGKMIKKPFYATAEIPFSEENWQKAEAEAVPGTVQLLNEADAEPAPHNGQSSIQLIDRATGKLYEVYIENGQLMMEVL